MERMKSTVEKPHHKLVIMNHSNRSNSSNYNGDFSTQ